MPTQTTTVITHVKAIPVYVAAFGLIAASASFTTQYGYASGLETSQALAYTTALFAFSLDITKPLALAVAFSDILTRRAVRGVAMLLLALAAIAYSSTSELSLISGNRASIVDGRKAIISKLTRLTASRKAVLQTLEGIPSTTRTVGALTASIQGVETKPGILIDGVACGGIWNGPITKEFCPTLSLLKAELANAQVRGAATTRLSQLDTQLSKLPEAATGTADPTSSNIVAYLSTVGISTDTDRVSSFLSLIPMFCIEIGSAFSIVLLQAFTSNPAATQKVRTTDPLSDYEDAAEAYREAATATQTDRRELSIPVLIERRVALSQGRLEASQAQLAKDLGISKSSVQRGVSSLVASGKLTVSKQKGTRASILVAL